MFVEVTINELKVGMYLVEIIEPKGKFQLVDGGLIKSKKMIESLQKKGVERLSIDPERAKKKLMTKINSFSKNKLLKLN